MNDSVAAKRRQTISGIVAGFVASAAAWWLLFRYLPAPPIEPLPAAFALVAVAALLTLVAGVEAIAHERLVTQAIDPLAGVETARMRVNARYLQNTVEQFIVFAAGLIALVAYASTLILVIATMVWVGNRWAFWIGYHRSPLKRGWAAAGMIQSMAVLLYVTWRFVGDGFGPVAAVAVVALFGVIEAILTVAVLRRPQ